MRLLSLLSLAALALALPSPRAVSGTGTTIKTTTPLGLAANPHSPTLSRDGGGGGGGLLGGQSIWTFCDSQTAAPTGAMNSFVANTLAWTSPVLPPAGGAPVLTDTLGAQGQAVLGIPFSAAELAYNDAHDGAVQRYAVWPGSGLVPLRNGSAVLFPGVTMVDATSGSVEYTGVYNTLVTLSPGDAAAGGAPKVVRGGERMWSAPEVAYGSFAGVAGVDGWLYLFGTSSSGVRVARVSEAGVGDVGEYAFYTAEGTWSGKGAVGEAADLFGAKLSSGDVFYSPHAGTFVMVYMNGYADSRFYVRYSTDGGVTSWGEESLLYESPVHADGEYNYAGHAHPEFDESGKTLVLSYTYGRDPYETKVVKVEFE